ncbi:hypothetical protein FISHEDRAFT_65156 [Fistulina hepatica ATCC 64428]|uniref:Yeast cell wall synthesis Kre9/Knh1-like N-terminal domain-containing protein n=1 Tax=Fistulina hepatica ATCC 64428 TaxID=1128425 RepID=A0A0D7AEH1_9AGAR|nr:hypothetical protein FISHEDRAFT_65156 [Fistulina hepatica ATCC 64428]
MLYRSTTVLAALASSALANVYVTSPTAASVFTAGQNETVSWQNDGNSPSLLEFGLATFSIYVGDKTQQTRLQLIATGVNVSSTSSLSFTPSSSIGPNSDEYFIRVESQSLLDPSEPQYYEMAFSSKFNLTNMSGTFNSSVQSEINGQSTAPLSSAVSTSSAASTSAAASVSKANSKTTSAVTSSGSKTASHTSSAATTSASSSSATNSANSLLAVMNVALLGAVAFVGVTLF